MTIGELARLFNEHFAHRRHARGREDGGLAARHVRRRRPGLPWVMPSPNMPTLDTAVVYPGTVLFEGTMLSEGRGTTRPFELVGAPWIDAERFADAMNALELPGVYFRPAVFEPTFQKHAKQPCGGCQIHVTDRRRVPPGAHRRRADPHVPAARPAEVRVAAAAVRVRARQAADRHPRRLGRAAAADRSGTSRSRRSPRAGSDDEAGVRRRLRAASILLY